MMCVPKNDPAPYREFKREGEPSRTVWTVCELFDCVYFLIGEDLYYEDREEWDWWASDAKRIR